LKEVDEGNGREKKHLLQPRGRDGDPATNQVVEKKSREVRRTIANLYDDRRHWGVWEGRQDWQLVRLGNKTKPKDGAVHLKKERPSKT